MTASVGVLVAASVWGLYWIPVRWLNAAGLQDVWINFSFFLIGFLFLSFFIARFRNELSLDKFITGFFVGGAFVLYGVSLVTTQIVTALLLFYVTPVWGTLFGRVLLNEKLTANRIVALILALLGLAVILGYEQNIPMPRNLGDWFALGSGISWAYGSVRIYREQTVSVLSETYVFFVGGLVAAIFLVLLPINEIGNRPATANLISTSPWILLVTAIYLPTMVVILWGAKFLNPGRIGILLMSELIVGVISAALLAGEPFGWREILGTCLIAGAALVEVMHSRHQEADSAIV